MKDFFIHQNRDVDVVVGGVISLMDFTTDKIAVRVKGGYVTVTGQKLVILRFDENEIKIMGRINEVVTNVAH